MPNELCLGWHGSPKLYKGTARVRLGYYALFLHPVSVDNFYSLIVE